MRTQETCQPNFLAGSFLYDKYLARHLIENAVWPFPAVIAYFQGLPSSRSRYRSPFFQYGDKNIKKSQKCQFFFHYIVFFNMKVLSYPFDCLDLVA